MEPAIIMKKEKAKHKIKDHFLSQEIFSLELEKNTEILKTTPKPAPDNLSAYYDSSEYLSHQKNGATFFMKSYFLSKKNHASFQKKNNF